MEGESNSVNHREALTLRNELRREGKHTSVDIDWLDQYQRSLGCKVVAVLTENSKIVDEVHHINMDRTGAIHI